MNIVEVCHKCGGKSFWFEVPDELRDMIHEGSSVVCSTKVGNSAGIARTSVFSGDGIEMIAVQNGATLPLKSVIAVQTNYPLSEIKIGNHMKMTRPARKKIVERLKEYYEDEKFYTRVSIDKRGYLVDGYSAYLVAKMFDLKEIPVMIESKRSKDCVVAN